MVRGVLPLQRVIPLGWTIGMIMLATRLLDAVPQIVIIGAILSGRMYRKPLARTTNGILYLFVVAATNEMTLLKLMRPSYLFQVTSKVLAYE